MRVNCPRARTINALKSGFAGVFLPSFLEAHLADFAKISPALKKRAAQIKLLLMDVDGTMTDGSVTLLSQTDGRRVNQLHFKKLSDAVAPASASRKL